MDKFVEILIGVGIMLFEVFICGFDMCMLVDIGFILDFLFMFGCFVDLLWILFKYCYGEILL